jgi:hypothetical protein
MLYEVEYLFLAFLIQNPLMLKVSSPSIQTSLEQPDYLLGQLSPIKVLLYNY